MELSYVNNEFTIMQITDTHLGESPLSKKSLNTLTLIRKAIEKLQPDLVIHTGDITWSHGISHQYDSLQALLEIFHDIDTPLITTFGNHDSEGNISRNELRTFIESDTKVNVPERKYHEIFNDRACDLLEIKSNGGEVKQVVYIMDSGDYPEKKGPGVYAWLSLEQIEWFKRVSQKYPNTNNNLVFLHIPLPEYNLSGRHIIEGHFNEGENEVCSPELNSGLFCQLIENDSIWGIFAGHDHDNNFDSVYQGIHCVYGQVTGYETYGDEKRGVRLIHCYEEDQQVTTERVTEDDIL